MNTICPGLNTILGGGEESVSVFCWNYAEMGYFGMLLFIQGKA